MQIVGNCLLLLHPSLIFLRLVRVLARSAKLRLKRVITLTLILLIRLLIISLRPRARFRLILLLFRWIIGQSLIVVIISVLILPSPVTIEEKDMLAVGDGKACTIG